MANPFLLLPPAVKDSDFYALAAPLPGFYGPDGQLPIPCFQVATVPSKKGCLVISYLKDGQWVAEVPVFARHFKAVNSSSDFTAPLWTMRPAQIGDQGTLVGQESHGSIATLLLQVAENEQAFIYGDRRMVADLVATFAGEPVEVVEGEGSPYGAHDILPLEPFPR